MFYVVRSIEILFGIEIVYRNGFSLMICICILCVLFVYQFIKFKQTFSTVLHMKQVSIQLHLNSFDFFFFILNKIIELKLIQSITSNRVPVVVGVVSVWKFNRCFGQTAVLYCLLFGIFFLFSFFFWIKLINANVWTDKIDI